MVWGALRYLFSSCVIKVKTCNLASVLPLGGNFFTDRAILLNNKSISSLVASTFKIAWFWVSKLFIIAVLLLALLTKSSFVDLDLFPGILSRTVSFETSSIEKFSLSIMAWSLSLLTFVAVLKNYENNKYFNNL